MLTESVSDKKLKSVNIWQSYEQERDLTLPNIHRFKKSVTHSLKTRIVGLRSQALNMLL